MESLLTPDELQGIDTEGFNISELEKFLKPGGIANFSTLFPPPARPTREEVVLKIFFYVVSFGLAFVGNTLIVAMILTTCSLRTVFNLYIVNLAVADLTVALSCMWIHLVTDLSEHYPFGGPVCRASTFLQVLSVTVSIFTLSIVVIDRFISTSFPSSLSVTQRWQKIIISLIWILGVVLSLPWLLYTKLIEFDWAGGHERHCEEIFPSDEARRIYITIFTSIVYTLPVCIMTVLMILTVIHSSQKFRSPPRPTSQMTMLMKKRAQQMLVTVLSSFIICWTPQQATLLWDVYRDPDKPKPPNLAAIKYSALYLAYSNSAVNPIIYFSFNECFRHVLWKFVRCKAWRDTDARIYPAPSMSVVSISSGR